MLDRIRHMVRVCHKYHTNKNSSIYSMHRQYREEIVTTKISPTPPETPTTFKYKRKMNYPHILFSYRQNETAPHHAASSNILTLKYYQRNSNHNQLEIVIVFYKKQFVINLNYFYKLELSEETKMLLNPANIRMFFEHFCQILKN